MAPKTIPCIPGAGIANLNNYTGKSIELICPFGYGKLADLENHCAHFVSHVLNIQVGTVCSGMLEYVKTSSTTRQSVRDNEKSGMKGFLGASIRVNQIYNSIVAASKGEFDTRPSPADDCLIYATVPGNLDKGRTTMGEMSKKHVGIHHSGNIWHYGNSGDAVACDSIAAFKVKFQKNYGAGTVFLWSELPGVGTQCVHGGALATITSTTTATTTKTSTTP